MDGEEAHYQDINGQFLKNWDPLLLEELDRLEGAPVEVRPGTEGGWTVSQAGFHFHDPKNPQAEAIGVVGIEPCRVHLHFGFGLGYFAEADEVAPEGMILVFEPNPELVKAALKVRDLRQLFRKKLMYICCSLPRYRLMVSRFCVHHQSARLMVSGYHETAYPDQLKAFLKTVDSASPVRTIEYVARMYPYILEQTVSSWRHSCRLPDAVLWRDKLRDQAAVIVAAGPSLDGNIERLAELKDRLVVFAIARSAGPLERVGVDPQILVHVEPQPYDHLIRDRKNLSQTVFMLADQTQSAYFTHDHKATYVFQSNTNTFSRYLIQHHPDQAKLNVSSGGSVATVAFYLAWLAGCNPIILVGQDLALKGERIYAEDPKNQPFQYEKDHLLEVPGWFGEPVLTLPHYHANLKWYERAAREMKEVRPDLQLINATEGGARLEGFQQMTLKEAAEQLGDGVSFREPAVPEKMGLNKRQVRQLYGRLKDDVQALEKLVESQQRLTQTFARKLAFMEMPHPIQDLPIEPLKTFLSFFRRNPALLHIFGCEAMGARTLLEAMIKCKTPDHCADAWARLMALHDDTLFTCRLLLRAV